MSDETPDDPRLPQAGATDESLVSAHEKASAGGSDQHARYRLMPLVLLFIFSGLVFAGGAYLDHNAGHFSSHIFDPRQPVGAATAVVTKIDPVAMGQHQFGLACIACHQANGQGIPGVYPPLAGSELAQGPTERVISVVLHGLKGPVVIEGKTFNAAQMPAFGQVPGSGYNWSDAQIAAVLTYVRQAWGNKAGPIQTEEVTAMRNKEGSRGAWTIAELDEKHPLGK